MILKFGASQIDGEVSHQQQRLPMPKWIISDRNTIIYNLFILRRQ